jgi:ABC-type dipeptide/oligopeptide/nickel transport system ATPase subunit
VKERVHSINADISSQCEHAKNFNKMPTTFGNYGSQKNVLILINSLKDTIPWGSLQLCVARSPIDQRIRPLWIGYVSDKISKFGNAGNKVTKSESAVDKVTKSVNVFDIIFQVLWWGEVKDTEQPFGGYLYSLGDYKYMKCVVQNLCDLPQTPPLSALRDHWQYPESPCTHACRGDVQDAAQTKALHMTVCMQAPIVTIHGPPGCGKTYTIARIASTLAQSGRRVVVCAQSNHAVQNAENAFKLISCANVKFVTVNDWIRQGDKTSLNVALIVDEASQIPVSETVALLTQNVSHLVLVGDPQQLGPRSPKYRSLLDTILTDVTLDTWCVRLTTQRRMCATISQYVSHTFYHDTLQCVSRENDNVSALRYVLYDAGHAKRTKPSITNAIECDTVQSMLSSDQRRPLLIICMYKDQCKQLRTRLKDHLSDVVTVATVDAAQGIEADHVWILMTNDTCSSYLANTHRFCVAVSRARYNVVLFASTGLRKDPSLAPMYEDYFRNSTPLI